MKSVSRVNERLVNLQIEWRLSELLAIAHEHAALPHQPDGGAHGILIRCFGGRKRRTRSVALARNGIALVVTKLRSALLGRTFSQAKMRM